MNANWPDASAEQAGTAIAVQRLGRLLQRTTQKSLRSVGLTFTEFELLCALRVQAPPHRLTPSKLYDAMLISSGGLTKVLKGLEARELVLRPMDIDDGRSRPVALTPSGRALVETAIQQVQTAEEPVVRSMSQHWRGPGSLSDALVSLADAAERAGDDPADQESQS